MAQVTEMKWLVYGMFRYPRRSGKCVGCVVSMVGTVVGCVLGPGQAFNSELI